MDRLPVLYVEDNALNVLIMEALFDRRPGLRPVVAGTLAEALEQACDLYPVLLLLDLRLPDGDGRALLPMLRRIPGCETAPSVAVTAESDVGLRGSGFQDLWSKAMDLKSVLHKLDVLADSVQSTRNAPVHPSQGWFPRPTGSSPAHGRA